MRSLLFVPGDSARKFDKARQGAADALILDLEDSVAPDRKDEARAIVREMLSAERGAQLLYVRVNALDTRRTLADIAAISPCRPDGIVLPKCESAEHLRQVSLWLDGIEAASGIQVGTTRIVAIATETAASVFGLGGYAGVTGRLAGLMWGAEDLSASLGATGNRAGRTYHSPYRLARDLCLMGAAAAGVAAIDTVYTDIEDLEGLAEEARAARRDGFSAKAVIHPKHVEAVNAAFTPGEEEVAWARRIVAAFAGDAGLGVVRIDGRMIDKPHLRAAEKILAAAGRP
ncbi:HpcH/HpaI aldolase/citrate lyase family protein [Enterovirga aerilata]|uniref:CoA ester lyase n=1 Tax=Enterovirga aerilata TaxID=2730920 RepID=A0A849IFT4_9HYPH|nr:CoA ester lyase [Enterovirga sp. DB1703]NNM72773.1 CoA ester lyase [Enterovirga sp. DB1703]